MSTIMNEQPLRSHRAEHELIPPDSLLAPYVSVNPGRMHGEPCFVGTRVPIQTLFDYLSAGDTIDEFLEGFAPVCANR